MHTFDLTPKDVELIDEAKKKIMSLYEEDKHHVGAAIRMKTGEMISAVHIELAASAESSFQISDQNVLSS
ncbi:cytidine deaminase [Bacillus safensis]|nr:cytidine deaminase [Bacillus safensis]